MYKGEIIPPTKSQSIDLRGDSQRYGYGAEAYRAYGRGYATGAGAAYGGGYYGGFTVPYSSSPEDWSGQDEEAIFQQNQ